MESPQPCKHCGRAAEPQAEITVNVTLDAKAAAREIHRVLRTDLGRRGQS